jgi:hypothetical protein
MAASALSFDNVRAAGLPVYSLRADEKRDALYKLLRYDHTGLITDGKVGQTMHGLALAWHYFPHAWGVRCNGRLSPLDTFADDNRLQWSARLDLYQLKS